MALLRVEHWSNLACVSGAVKLGVLPINSFVVKDTLDGIATRDARCSVVASKYEHCDELEPKTVLRAVYVDGSTAAGAFDEFIIDIVDHASGFGSGVVSIVALDPIFMLSREASLVTGAFSGTISSVLTGLLADGAPSEFSVGNITPTSAATIDLTNATTLAGIQELAKQCNAGADLAAGQTFSFQARRNGVTSYLIDCIYVGGSASTLDVRLSKNLHALKQRQKRGDNPTRLYFTAMGQTIADAWFEVVSVVNGTDFTVGVVDEPDLNPIFMDGAYTDQGLYVEFEDGTRTPITGDIRSTRTLSIADTSALTAGDLFRFVADTNGTAVTYLDIPNTRPHYDTYDAPIPPGTNWLPNANFAEWQGTSPDVPEDWDDEWLVPVAGEWEEETTTTLLGASAAKSPATGDIYFLRPNGNGWSGSGKTFYCREGDTVTYVLWGRAAALTGAAVVYFGNPNNGDAEGVSLIGAEPSWSVAGAWQTVSRAYEVAAAGNKTLQFVIFKQANTEYIFAGGMIVITPKGQAIPEGFFLGSSGARAWVMAVNRFLERIEAHSYEVQFRDLTRDDASTNPYDTVTLGQTASVTAPDLLDETLTLRVVGAEFDLLEPLDTKLTLANKRDTLTDQLFGGLTFNTTNVQGSVGTPVDLSDPGDPPPPPPTPVSNDGPFMVWGPAPSLTASRIATARGGTTLHNEAGTLGIRSPATYTGATDPTTEDDEDVAGQDLWLEPTGEGDAYWVQRFDGDDWIQHGGTVPAPADPADDGKVLTASGGVYSWETGGGGSGVDLEDEGGALGTFDTIDFVGSSVAVTNDGGGHATVTIALDSGAAITDVIEVAIPFGATFADAGPGVTLEPIPWDSEGDGITAQHGSVFSLDMDESIAVDGHGVVNWTFRVWAIHSAGNWEFVQAAVTHGGEIESYSWDDFEANAIDGDSFFHTFSGTFHLAEGGTDFIFPSVVLVGPGAGTVTVNAWMVCTFQPIA